MTDLPRWTISELKVRYDLEPGLDDIFVEGYFDKEVITEYIKGRFPRRVIYEIDSVDVSRDLLTKHGFTKGNKQRVIVLARELAAMPGTSNLVLLVDRDLDHWFGALEEVGGLVWTEYSSLEMYFFSDQYLVRILLTLSKAQIVDWSAFYESFVGALRALYAIRLAERQLSLSLVWLLPDRCLEIDGSAIILRSNEYIDRILNKNKQQKSKALFMDVWNLWQTKLVGDPRGYIHGHDFIDLLAWAIRNFRGLRVFSDGEPLYRVLIAEASRNAELERLSCCAN